MKQFRIFYLAILFIAASGSLAASTKQAPLEFKIHHKTVLPVSAVENVQMQAQPEENNWAVTFKLNDVDAKTFEKITEENTNQDLEIFLDGRSVLSPKIRTTIHDGRIMVTSPTEKKAVIIYRRLLKIHS